MNWLARFPKDDYPWWCYLGLIMFVAFGIRGYVICIQGFIRLLK